MVGEEGRKYPSAANDIPNSMGLKTPNGTNAIVGKSASLVPPEYVYVFADDTGRSKVGRSENPVRRKTNLQDAAGRPLVLFVAYPTTDSRRLEEHAHRALGSCRVRGEWFSCSPDIAAYAIEDAAVELRLIVEAHQLDHRVDADGHDFFCLKPAENDVVEPSRANRLLWGYNKLGIDPSFRHVVPREVSP